MFAWRNLNASAQRASPGRQLKFADALGMPGPFLYNRFWTVYGPGTPNNGLVRTLLGADHEPLR